jgi:hypothetical protein
MAAAAKRNLEKARAKRRSAASFATRVQMESASRSTQAAKAATAAKSKVAAGKTMAERIKPKKPKAPPKLNRNIR